MIDFACTRCAHCCSNTQSVMADGHTYGLYLTPAEAKHFPGDKLMPLFKAGSRIIAYQLRDNICPCLNDANECTIYEDRPLICQAFPVLHHGAVQADCKFVSEHYNELISLKSLVKEQEASDERIRQAEAIPRAEWKFPLDIGRWIRA